MGRKPFEFTKKQKAFVKENYNKMSNAAMARKFKMNFSTFSGKVHEMGLFRMKMQYWTARQTKFLVDNYKIMGNTELAEIFNKKWKKDKGWTIKHIEKKLKYLVMKRTKEEIIEIEQRNLDQGRLNTHMKKGKSNFLTTGPSKQGEIRMYRGSTGILTSRIRIGKRWVYWPRWAWIKKHGPIQSNMVVVMKDDNPYNTVDTNLELVTRSESTRRYAALCSTYAFLWQARIKILNERKYPINRIKKNTIIT